MDNLIEKRREGNELYKLKKEKIMLEINNLNKQQFSQ